MRFSTLRIIHKNLFKTEGRGKGSAYPQLGQSPFRIFHVNLNFWNKKIEKKFFFHLICYASVRTLQKFEFFLSKPYQVVNSVGLDEKPGLNPTLITIAKYKIDHNSKTKFFFFLDRNFFQKHLKIVNKIKQKKNWKILFFSFSLVSERLSNIWIKTPLFEGEGLQIVN